MDKLNEEYYEYLNLLKKREELDGEITNLIGKNDEVSIKNINEIGKRLGEINIEISKFDNELFTKIDNYFTILKDIDKINEDIKLIEKYSKKVTYANDRVEVFSAEGRKKLIDKEYSLRYQELASQKKMLRKKALDSYRDLEKITSIKKNEEKMITSNPLPIPVREITSYDYESLSLDEKIEETKKRINRIFDSFKLPNMGKKVVVSYDGSKYTIPEKYKGRYNATIAELNTLLNKKKSIEDKGNVVEVDSSTKKEDNLSLSKLNRLVEDNRIVLHPVEVTFNYIPKVSLDKAFVGIRSKINTDKFKKVISIYNIDKKIELSYRKMESKLLDKGIIIKTNGVKIANYTISKYSAARTFVKSTSKKVSSYVSSYYSEFRGYLSNKKDIISNVKSGDKIKESMENVYGENKEKHLDYRVVNRMVTFNENACQRIDEAKGNIVKVSKSVAYKIKEPFDKLRKSMQDDVERKELENQIQRIKQEALMKQQELRKIKIKSDSGYVAMGGLLVVGTIAVAAIIFTVIGNLLG